MAVDFDLDLAVREDSENPVYYVQYAHARICSLVAKVVETKGISVPAAAEVDATLLQTPEELALLKTSPAGSSRPGPGRPERPGAGGHGRGGRLPRRMNGFWSPPSTTAAMWLRL